MSFGPKRGSRRFYQRNCAECGRLFVGHDIRQVCCSHRCATTGQHRRANASDDYHRHKRSVRRSVERSSDFTPKQEAAMRRKARKCPMPGCGVKMTDIARTPNSKELDHIVPLNIGGTHTIGNVRIICRTCNLKRPKDGSDLIGWQPTLWAQVPEVMMPAVKAKPTPKPKVTPDPRYCRCGARIRVQGRAGERCRDCIMELGRTAWRMRQEGVKWQDIANALDYPNTGGIYQHAMKYGRAQMSDMGFLG